MPAFQSPGSSGSAVDAVREPVTAPHPAGVNRLRKATLFVKGTTKWGVWGK